MSNNTNSYDLWEEVHNPPKLFFEDEVRDGFLISTMMKRYWAAQMKVLAEIDKVCKRHHLNWYADYGTMLGAVRHGGYIPWDDDMDICMFRDEYVKFIEYAAEELPKGYEVMTLQRNEEFGFAIGRINNTHFINYNDDHLESHFGCPYLVGIDVFPLDGLFTDKKQEEERVNKLKDIGTALIHISENLCDCIEYKELIKKIEKENGVSFKGKENLKRELMLLADELYVLVSPKDAEDVAMMTHWASKHNHRYKKEWFDKTVYLQYEYIHLPVPACYDKVLKAEYGNYMRIVKGGGAHEYPLYAGQEELLKKELGGNPFRYTMPVKIRETRNIPSVKDRCNEIISMLKQVSSKVLQLDSLGQYDTAEQLMNGLVTLVDSIRPILQERARYYEATSLLLDEYKDTLSGYLNDTNDQHREEHANRADALVDQLTDAIEAVSERKEVLFLPVKADWWKAMEPEWRQAVADENNDVYVMPLLYLEKDFVRDNGEERNDGDLLPDYVELTSIEDYDIAKRHPDVVYIQDPYDGYNTMIAVPSYFYSDNLLKFTDKLVYVPCYDVDDPESPDDKITSALRIIVEQPAVYNADKVIVKDSKIKEVYIDILSSITGREFVDYWRNKISVSESFVGATLNSTDIEISEQRKEFFNQYGLDIDKDKRILLMQINAAFIIQNGKKAIDKINSTIDEMNKYEDSLICVFSKHESLDQLGRITNDTEIAKEFETCIDQISKTSNVIYDKKRIVKDHMNIIDAYYGNEGEFAHRIRTAKKPVMIMVV